VIFKIKSLGEICKFQGGSQPPKSNFIYEPKNGYIRFLQIRDFGSENNHTYIPEDKKNKICNSDDIMIGRYGASVGKILRGRRGAYNVALMKATPLNSLVNKEYLWNYFKSPIFQDNLEKVASRSAQDGFSKDDIFDFKVPLPPLPIQQKIVEKLDAIFAEIDKARAAAEANAKNAEALFQSYLTQVIEGGSEDWREFQIKELGKVITGNTPKTSEPENYGDFISFVKPGDFNSDGTIDLEKQKLSQIGMSVSRVVKEKSALMVCIGATIGKCGFVEVDVVTNQQINSVTPNSDFSHKFIYLQMLTSSFQKKIINSSGQATLPIINKSKWESLTMKFPPLSKQLEIVERFENLRFETQNLKNSQLVKIRNTHLFKQSILKQAFNGELVKAA
jgi:type I restriction enzyme S subunit